MNLYVLISGIIFTILGFLWSKKSSQDFVFKIIILALGIIGIVLYIINSSQ